MPYIPIRFALLKPHPLLFPQTHSGRCGMEEGGGESFRAAVTPSLALVGYAKLGLAFPYPAGIMQLSNTVAHNMRTYIMPTSN